MGCTSEKNFPDSTKSKNGNDNSRNENLSQIKNSQISFRCFYDIKNSNDVQIINNTYIKYNENKGVNEEILKKIKILNDGKKEELILNKKFESIGINTVDFIIEEKLNNMNFMFYNCESLKKIEFISFDTSNVINMNSMFEGCKNLEDLDVSNFDTSNVIDMGNMFYGCSKLKEIKGINNFNTFMVNNMTTMFQECYELEYLDLSNFNTSRVEDMEAMFNKCHKLKEIKGINNFDLTNVKNKEKIFDGCINLNQNILSKFNVTINNNNEKHILILFCTNDYSIRCFIPCYISDIFTTIEKKFYDKFPKLKNQKVYFTANGNTINRSETLEKNNITSSANILINY